MTTQCTKNKMYVCERCGNIVVMLHDGGGELACCGEPMREMLPNTVDAAKEKHVPVICVDGDTVYVEVGSAPHPMQDEHYIHWVYLQTTQGGQCKLLKPGQEPKVAFALTAHERPLFALEYCNLHGLWMAQVK